MLDTNICIYIIKKRPIHVLHRLQKQSSADIAMSSITLSELDYGVQKSADPTRNKLALAQFMAPIEIVPYDEAAASKYGEIWADLEKKGCVIGSMDMLIAAHCVSRNLTLVTNNTKEFKRVEKLKLDNWA